MTASTLNVVPMPLADLTARIQDIATRHPIGYLLKFDLGSTGIIHVDGNQTPSVITNEDGAADVTVKVSEANLEALLNGSLNPMAALMFKKIQIEGDMGKAMKLAQILS